MQLGDGTQIWVKRRIFEANRECGRTTEGSGITVHKSRTKRLGATKSSSTNLTRTDLNGDETALSYIGHKSKELMAE